ncbi:MAG TPA: hypothetical protein VLA61_10200 [Ideonella sp.]|uniref:hypothetical protein n=1 Tax=Ideonella sp. TaxID=1929293 RepID=UPI002CE73F2D|nr:hypothetical protein [Ideonella sp.]HSI48631.1 hypothetical protein [Ideonella sp.]
MSVRRAEPYPHAEPHGHDHSHAEPHGAAAVAPHAPDGVPPRQPVRREAFAHIPGWGADLAKADRPAYPMERQPPRLDPLPSGRPVQQRPSVEVLHSTERPGLTPVFGTGQPPKGLSGMLRRVAFKFSESDLRHWLVLLFADRVNMVEGVCSDLAHGHVPRVYAEMGGRAELKHNPAGAARKAAAVVAVAGLAYLLLRSRQRRRQLR